MKQSSRNHAGAGRVLVLSVILLMAWVAVAQAQLEEKLEALDNALGEIYDGKTVSLAECIQVAKVGSANLGLFEETLRSAETDRRAAWWAWGPDLRGAAGWTRSERTDFDQEIFDPFTGPTGFFEDATSIFTNKNYSFTANWFAFSGFDRSGAMKASRADLEAGEYDLGYQKELLEESVSQAYYNLVRAMKQLGVAAESEDLAKRELDRSETYFDLGIATRSDVLQAKVRHEQTRLESVQARNGERQAFVNLTHLMNIPAAQGFDIDASIPDISAEGLPELDGLLQSAQSERLDVASARSGVVASEGRLTRARSGFYPSVNVFAQFQRSESESPQSLRFGAAQNKTVAWGAQLNWNLWDRWLTKSQSRRAVADRRRAEYNLRQAQLDAEREIVQFLNNLIEAKERYAVASGTVEQAQEDLRLANERFRVGAGTSLDVINAQVSLTRARNDEVNAVADYLIAKAQLARATGN